MAPTYLHTTPVACSPCSAVLEPHGAGPMWRAEHSKSDPGAGRWECHGDRPFHAASSLATQRFPFESLALLLPHLTLSSRWPRITPIPSQCVRKEKR